MSGWISVTVPSYARASPHVSSGCVSATFQWQRYGRLVDVETVVDDEGDLGEPLRELEVRRRA